MDNSLRIRLKTASVLVAAMLAMLLFAHMSTTGRLVLFVVGFFLCAIASIEFARVSSSQSGSFLKTFGYVFAAMLGPLSVLCLAFALRVPNSGLWVTAEHGTYLLFATYLSFLVAIAMMFIFGRSLAVQCGSIAQDIFIAVLLIGLGGSCLISLVLMPQGLPALVWLLCVVIGNDTGAYFVGRRVGGALFAPYISPKKTVSGSVGGLVCGVLAGILLSSCLPVGLSVSIVAVIALLAGIASQAGDLSKSYVKRLHGVKDMGAILPGHGGVLDRIDGVLGAAPILYCVLLIF